jgi:hypothetical protein
MHRVAAILLAIALLSGGCLSANVSAIVQQQPQQKLSIGIAEVSVDVVVRDKQGRPVKGLTASDFEIYEEGVLQQVTSSRMVSVEPQNSGTNPTTPGVASLANSALTNATGSTEAPRVTAVAFIFDRLSIDSLAAAREAALSYVGANMKLDCLAAVYVIDLSLDVVQPLTRDAQLIKSAIQQAGARLSVAPTSSGLGNSHFEDELAGSYNPRARTPPRIPSGDRCSKSQVHLLRLRVCAEQLGLATTNNGLIAAIDWYKALPDSGDLFRSASDPSRSRTDPGGRQCQRIPRAFMPSTLPDFAS